MKMKLRISLIALCVLVFVSLAQAYPSGSPKCSNHVPKHETNKAQTTPSPFKLTTSAVTKKDGKSTVTVTISSTDGTKFKGFFVYATTPDGNDKLGQFTKTDKTKVLKCGSASAITHSKNDKKSSITLTWTADENQTGDIEFRATVVKEFVEFWTGIKSPKVTL